MTTGHSTPVASVVVPARDEAAFLPATLESLASMTTELAYEVLVVDGDSDDRTPEIARAYGARLVEGDGSGIAAGRNRGARRARGDWLCFVDADTTVAPTYLDEMLSFAARNELQAASSRVRMDGWRSLPMQATINRVFPRLRYPILPGFNLVVRRSAFERLGGFPSVPNEDTAFSRRLARRGSVGYHPEPLVETSARRIRESGLTGTLVHYLRLDWERLRSGY